jgi:hypothetical protein
LGELYQNSVSDDIISRQYLPAMRFLEEVNAYLEQLNAAKCHKDPFLVAFTLTTDASAMVDVIWYNSRHERYCATFRISNPSGNCGYSSNVA